MDEQSKTTPRDAGRRARWLAAAALVGAAAPGAFATGAQAAPGEQVVTVAAGETVSHVAVRTGSTVDAIVDANGLDDSAAVRAGQQLRVPADGAASAPAGREHVVRAGETLTSIAAATGTTVGALRDANGLDARGFLREGQVLRLDGTPRAAAAGTGASSTAAGSYTVRPGDTLSRIAAARGTTVAALVDANGLDERGFIVEGQRLRVPGASTGGGTPAQRPATERAGTLAGAVEANRARLAAADLPSRAEVREIVRSTAVRLGVDPALALAVAHQESGFRMDVVSGANAIGAMQVIPSSGEWASDLLDEDIDLFDPRDNAKAGVVILRTLTAADPPEIAIASYYQGQASVRSRGMYDDTRAYVANVQALQARYS